MSPEEMHDMKFLSKMFIGFLMIGALAYYFIFMHTKQSNLVDRCLAVCAPYYVDSNLVIDKDTCICELTKEIKNGN